MHKEWRPEDVTLVEIVTAEVGASCADPVQPDSNGDVCICMKTPRYQASHNVT